MPEKRVFGTAAVFASRVCAGTMESNNGNAKATPAPRNIVRRDMCFFVMNIVSPYRFNFGTPGYSADTLARGALLRLWRIRTDLNFLIHLERVALHDSQDQR